MPSAARPPDEAPQPLALAGVERRRGLVEREHGRAREQADRDVHALAVAAGQARELFVRRDRAGRSARASARPPRRGRRRAPGGRTGRGSRRPRAWSRAPAAGAPSRLRRGPRLTLPALGRWMPARIESSVVLPAPLGPTTATSSPACGLEADVAQRLALAVAHREVRHAESRAHRARVTGADGSERGPHRSAARASRIEARTLIGTREACDPTVRARCGG